MKPPRSLSLTQTPQAIQQFLEEVGQVLAGNISFGTTTGQTDDQNILCSKASGASPGVADTEFAVAHNLGRVPLGYIVVSVNQAAIIYKSATAWTATNIYLKANAATVNYVLIII